MQNMWRVSAVFLVLFLLSACHKQESSTGIQQGTPDDSTSIPSGIYVDKERKQEKVL